VRDRLSFTRFLGLGIEDGIPDGRTLWLFRETCLTLIVARHHDGCVRQRSAANRDKQGALGRSNTCANGDPSPTSCRRQLWP
jgi:hypothetical protein